jgi:penicillin-binding protein 2
MQRGFSEDLSGDLGQELSDSVPGGLYSRERRTVGRGAQSIVLMAIVSVGLIGAIGSRLGYLQLTQGAKYRQIAEQNRVRTVAKAPVRGNILDRKGRLLAGNRLSHSVYVWPMVTKKATWPQTRTRLAELLDLSEDEIQGKIGKLNAGSIERVRIARDITQAQIVALQEYATDAEGVDIDIESIRHYPHNSIGAHVLGYTGELTDAQYLKYKSEGYRLGDTIGKMGVEAAFENKLRGEWGGMQVEVDGAGRLQQVLGPKNSQPGKDVTLTIDLDLQTAAEKALGDRRGAIVALDPRNGAVLAMVSQPAFNPNDLSGRISTKVWKELQGKDHPFLNRTLQGFPPASTFKIVTTTAGIESGKFKPDVILQTYASLNIGGTVFADWNHAGFGPLGFPGALKWSSDTFFYQIAQGVGGDTLLDWTRRYGFGQRTGIEIPAESKGLVPSDEWKRKNYKLEWKIGDTVNTSIGQGFLQTTPLQVARMFAVPANGGYLVKPHLLKDDEDKKQWRESLNLKPKTIEVIRKGLREVVDNGTGAVMNVPNIPPSAGKTGTAEAPPGPVHVWYGGYAPHDKPEIVVVAFGEHMGGGGGKNAAPMVLKVMESYFGYKPPADDKNKTKPKKS